MTTAQGKPQPEPDEQGRLYAFQVAPEPTGEMPAHEDVVRYYLARALAFYAATREDLGGYALDDQPRWGDALMAALPHLTIAALLAHEGEREHVSVDVWERGCMGELDDLVYHYAARHGIDYQRIRPYLPGEAREKALAEKYPHRITPVLREGGYIGWETACDAPADAWCRARSDCACELYGSVGRGEDGRWQHEVLGTEDGRVVHVMEPGSDECHQLLFLTADESLIPELYTGDATDLRPGRIELTWEGDDYSWDYADEASA